MFDKLITAIIAFINRGGDNGARSQQVTVEMQPKPIKYKSFFLLGDAFFTFHNDAEPKNFVKWLKKNHDQWYKEHGALIDGFARITFPELIETIFAHHEEDNLYSSLTNHLRNWFVQVHGRFSFFQTERIFVPLVESHLLQVLYDVSGTEITRIESPERIAELIPSPEDYKDNRVIGADSHGALEHAIVEYLASNADTLRVHFKFVNDNETWNERFVELFQNYGITNFAELKFESATTVPNDKVTIKRFNRYIQFNDFANRAEKIFKSFLEETPKAKRLDDIFILSVWNDKNHPKNDATYVNVAFGSRILLISHYNKGFSSTTEQGARLCFYRMETGEVNVTIFPAKTESRKPIEDAIVINHSVDPKKLNEKKLRSLWNILISYMECTSIDGDPSFYQKRKIKRLRYSHNMIIDNVHQPTKRSVSWQKIREFVLSVGLSGCILAILQLAYSKINPDTTSVNNKDEILLHIDSLQKVVRESAETISLRFMHSNEDGQTSKPQKEIDINSANNHEE